MLLKGLKKRGGVYKKSTTVLLKPSELSKIKELADKYAQGNMSAWVRYAATHFTPKKREIDPNSGQGA